MRKRTIPKQHQTKVALQTLRLNPAMVGVMGGMTVDEAVKHLLSVGYTEAQVRKLSGKEEQTEPHPSGLSGEHSVVLDAIQACCLGGGD